MAGRGKMDLEECKMFVGGLTRDTTADMLKGYFSYYGRIVHAVVMTNPETQKSRGFGFVAFERPEIVDRVLMSGPHFLDGKQIDPKPSVPKDLRPKPPSVEQPKKAFLGGLPLEMNETDLREYFSRYGVVTECYIMFDEKRMKSRGFGFVSFEDESIVDDIVSQKYIDVRSKRVEVKLARPRENPLAPLNSEGRVLSVDAQQQRNAAVEAASAHPNPPPYYYDPYNYYPPPPLQQQHYPPHPQGPYGGGGPPAPKRPRVGARTPPPYSPAPSSGYYQQGYDFSYDQKPAYGSRGSPPDADGGGPRSTKPMPALSAPGSGAASGSVAPFPASFSLASAPSGGSGSAADSSNMTPESMSTLMQQAIQNMGTAGKSGTGMNMNMMMPMMMSNMMTQMFMNQAQTMFQSMMQQRKSSEQTSTSDGQTSGAPGSSEVMDVMKNVLQTLMSTMQQQEQSKNDSAGK